MAPNSTIDFIVAQGAASTSVDAHSCSPKIVRDSWGSEIQRRSLISCSGSFELNTPMFQFDDFSKSEFELPRTRVLPDLRDHYGDFRRIRLHSIDEAQQERRPNLR